MKVIIDTSVFIAFFVKKESYHQEVLNKHKDYQKQRVQFITSDYVLAELFTRLIYDFGKVATQKAAEEITHSVENKSLSIIPINENIFKQAFEIMIKFSEHHISFTDATTYVLYKECKLDEIFTLDSDFKKMRAKSAF